MRKYLIVIFGVFTAFVGIWGGAFLCTIFPKGESPYDFAAFITGFIVFVFGVAVGVYGAFKPRNT